MYSAWVFDEWYSPSIHTFKCSQYFVGDFYLDNSRNTIWEGNGFFFIFNVYLLFLLDRSLPLMCMLWKSEMEKFAPSNKGCKKKWCHSPSSLYFRLHLKRGKKLSWATQILLLCPSKTNGIPLWGKQWADIGADLWLGSGTSEWP